ncbi:Hypothetical protein RAK1035_3096 [Roseovarius sp. AK1035]|nr:Hypothetical protein RAK1035_3096 [Roseovarius sp. AK1035]
MRAFDSENFDMGQVGPWPRGRGIFATIVPRQGEALCV